MTHRNYFEVEGNIIEDSKLEYTTSGTAKLTFSVANEVYGGSGRDNHVSFFNVTMWGKMAEKLCARIIKGCTVLFSCTGKIEKYTDRNGIVRYPFKCNIGPQDFIRFTAKTKAAQVRHDELKAQQQQYQQPNQQGFYKPQYQQQQFQQPMQQAAPQPVQQQLWQQPGSAGAPGSLQQPNSAGLPNNNPPFSSEVQKVADVFDGKDVSKGLDIF